MTKQYDKNSFFPGQRVVYTGKYINYSSRYIGQTGTVVSWEYGIRGLNLLHIKWDKPEVFPSSNWRPCHQNMESIEIDIGDLEDDL